jgi:O-antigen/teichoic acid export membrane protein
VAEIEAGVTEAVASPPRRARRGARGYFVASLVGQMAALVRYVVLARIIGPEELGLAAFLILTSQFLTSLSDTGSERFIVQDEDGDSPRLLSVVHSAMALRGLVIAAALLILAGPLAAFFKAPAIQASLMWLAVTPLATGFIHFGIRQAQRSNDFRSESATVICGELAALAGTAIAAFIVRDHTAVLYGLALRAFVMVGVSHATAKRPYRLGFSRPEAMRFTAFAAPLFLNGALLFLGAQGDRLVIGSSEGAKALGYYSAILLLVQSPMAALSRFTTTLHLPPLSARRGDPAQFDQAADRLGGRAALLTVLAAAGFTAVGPLATWILYGHNYVQPLLLFALLGAMQTLRFVRCWPNTVAIAVSKSSVITVNNFARLIAFPTALGCVAAGWGLAGVVAGYVAGELVALVVALVQLSLTNTIPLRRELTRVGLLSLLLAAICGWSVAFDAHAIWVTPVLAFVTAAALAVFVRHERPVLVEAVSFVTRRLGVRR